MLLQEMPGRHTNVNMVGERSPNTAIRALRESLGLSQEEFGRRAGLTQSNIARLESGQIRTSMAHAEKIAAAFGRNPRDCFPEAEGFSTGDDAELAARAATLARRLAGDNESWLPLVAAIAYVILDLERRGRSILDEENLALIESMIRRFQTGRG